MPAERYWRAVGLSAYGGGDVELGAVQLYEASAGDPSYSAVSLLLHFDGANGSTTFTDNSPSPKTVTASGSAALSTAQSRFGGASLAAGSDFIWVAQDASIDPVNADFTIEMWVRASSLSSSGILFNKADGTAGDYPYQAFVTSSGGIVFRSYTSDSERFTITTASGLIALNTWIHLAFVRSGSTFRVYVDGALAGSATYSGPLTSNVFALSIGAYSSGAFPFTGHIDDFRFTLGVARYSSSFTPAAAAFPDSVASGSITRVDQAATLTSTVPAVSGSIASLQDADPATTVRLAAKVPGLALVWDFGVGVQKEPVLAALGSASDSALFLSHFDLQSSADGVFWKQRAVLGRFGWPGSLALTSPSVGGLPLIVRAHSANLPQIAASATVSSHSAPAPLGLKNARDVEHGGPGRIWGTTKAKGLPNSPTKARVVLQHQRSKLPVREVWSDPVTGAFEFTGIDTNQQFLTLAEDAAGNFRPVAANKLVPEVSP